MNEKVALIDQELERLKTDLSKLTEKGTKVSAARARRALQNMRNLAHELRKEITDYKNTL